MAIELAQRRTRRQHLLDLGGLLAAGPAAARSGGAGMPAACAGAFVEWGSDGRETALAAWERGLKRPASSVPALDFYGGSGWDAFRTRAWLPGFWARANPMRRLVWSIPLTQKGTDLAEVGRGLHDEAFRIAASAIALAQPDAFIRIGWEMNVADSPWLAAGREAEYVRAYRRVVDLFRSRSSRFRFDWCPGWGPQAGPADRAYPGADVVDVIGLDLYDYDRGNGETVAARWTAGCLEAPFGLLWQRAFARAHRKPMSYPEWGVGQAGDNPYFIDRMADWFEAHADEIAYALYFDVDGAWPTRLGTGRFPRSAEALKRRFSASGA